MTIKINLPGNKLAGLYKLEKYDANGVLTGETGWIKNLITDTGMNYIHSSALSSSLWGGGNFRLGVGTGGAAPAYTNTQLAAGVAITTISTTTGRTMGNSGAPDYFAWERRTATFALGAINANLAEVGMLNGTEVTSPAITRSLIKDAEGNPTTFTVTSAEQLVVVYELRSYPNLNDITGTVDIENYDGSVYVDTTTYSFLSRSIRVQSSPVSSGQGDFTSGISTGYIPFNNNNMYVMASNRSAPYVNTTNQGVESQDSSVGSAARASTVASTAYVAGSFEYKFRATWLPDVANYPEGVGSVRLGASGSGILGRWFAIFLDPPLPKDETKKLDIDFTFTTGRA